MKAKILFKNFLNISILLSIILPFLIFIKNFFSLEEINIFMFNDIFEILLFTIKQSLISSFFCFIFSILPAKYAANNNTLLSKFIDKLNFIPFFFPVISLITIFSLVFSEKILGAYSPLYTLKIIIIAHTFYNSPIFVKYISEALKKVPHSLVEIMQLENFNRFQIFYKFEIFIILPQIFKAFILVFTYCFLSFAIILSLGGIKYTNLEIEIASSFRGTFNFSYAIILGLIQFIILGIINFLSRFIKEYEFSSYHYKCKTNIFTFIFSLLYTIIEYSVVLSSIILSFYDYFKGEFTLKYFLKLFNNDFNLEYPIIVSLKNSLLVAFVVSLLVVILAYLLIENYSLLVDIFIFSNMGLSGTFLAISLYYLYINFNINIFLLISFGYVISNLPIAYSFLYQSIKSYPKILDDNARIYTRNYIQAFFNVKFKILKNTFIAAFLQVFAIIFGEFTIAYTMQLGDIFPIASIINYNMISEKKYLESSAFSTLILIIIFILFMSGEIFKRKNKK